MRYLLALLFLVGCQTQPTKVFESHEEAVDFPKLQRPDPKAKIIVDKNTKVIDARDAFNYSMAHIRKSVNMSWREFSQRKPPFTGLLQEDLYFHTRRLARKGFAAESDTVIITQPGHPIEGGRLMWTLYYLGMKNVKMASSNYFRVGWTNHATVKPYESEVSWKPHRIESVWVRKDEVEKYLEDYPENVRVIDVRSSKEFMGKTGIALRLRLPDMKAINIPAGEFFKKNGRTRMRMAEQLKGVGLKPSHRIIVISNQGLRSAAVTMALLDLGFNGAGNYAGGYAELSAN